MNESMLVLDENINNKDELNSISNDINNSTAIHKNDNKKVDMMTQVRIYVMIFNA